VTDRERLKKMRELGVVWKTGKLPRMSSARMTPEAMQKADKLYDAMSDAFVDKMCSRRKP